MPTGKITFNCPGCGREFNVETRLKGRKVRCNQCKRLTVIPSSSGVRPKKIIMTTQKPAETKTEIDDTGSEADSTPENEPADEPADAGTEAPATARFKPAQPAGSTDQRTIAGLTTQLEELQSQRNDMEAELQSLREQQSQWENQSSAQAQAIGEIVQYATEAIDAFCKAQLDGMQELRQKFKALS